MGRYTDELINNIKREVSTARLVEQSGVTLKKQGKNLIGHCPFHDDKTPSLVVTPETNLWHCLGACQIGGSNIDWGMKSQGVSFVHAVEILRGDTPALAAAHQAPTLRTTLKKLPIVVSEHDEAQVLLNHVIEFYHLTLMNSEEGLAYLHKRGIGDRELVQRFKLGYANRTLNYRIPEKSRKDGEVIRGKLQGVGILRNSGHEHLSGSLVVPIFDEFNNVVEAYGRKVLDNRLRKGTPMHLYLPGPHRGVWNAEGLIDQEEVILCEALIDAMTFWVNGFKNVTASYGTGGFTEDHLNLFKLLQIKRVLIAYDRDEAGNQAAEALAKKLSDEGFDCYRILFPRNMDANEYALQVQPAQKSLGVVIRSAEWMGFGKAPERQLTIDTQSSDIESEPNVQEEIIPSLAAKEPANGAESEEPLAVIEISALPAAAVPPAPINMIEPEVSEHEIIVRFADRRYRVRGLQKNTSYEILKVNVLVNCGEAMHVDTLDMYSAKHRQAFGRVAASELLVEESVIQRDLGQLLLQLEALQDQAIQAALKPAEPTAYTMEEKERNQALELLRDPHLADRIVSDFIKTGLVGEPTNALMGYLASVSRKLAAPLAIIVQSTSAAGKSALMDAVLRLIPEEDKVHYSAMTGQSLFYLGEGDLKHKVLGISEEEGVRQAAYALKLLQSQGELTIASTGKDPQTGKLITEEYRVEGPVMLFLTTTAIDIDEELLNRCVVLTIDESRDQTEAIQARQRQRRTLSGLLLASDSDQVIRQHQNAQRLLRPLAVVNPYAEQLTFANGRTRTRRDHEKYLTLIDSIALLHQYQRPVKALQQNHQMIEYVEVTTTDIALANQLAHEVLGRSLDELPPPTRRLLNGIHALIQERIKQTGIRQCEVRITRREIREAAGLSDKQVRVHLDRLVELEYVFAHQGKNGQRFVYELVFDGQLEMSHAQLMGLIDVEQLNKRKNGTTTENIVASESDLVPSSGPASGLVVGTSCSVENDENISDDEELEE